MDHRPIFRDDEVLQFIPQRPPFVMIDSVYEISEREVTTGFHINQQNVLCKGKFFSEGGLVENIAQSAALFAGYGFSQKGSDIPLGFIASIKNLQIHKLPLVDTSIKTRIIFQNEIMNMHIVNGISYAEDQTELASCELRIFIKTETL